jgi:hypothetical protein
MPTNLNIHRIVSVFVSQPPVDDSTERHNGKHCAMDISFVTGDGEVFTLTAYPYHDVKLNLQDKTGDGRCGAEMAATNIRIKLLEEPRIAASVAFNQSRLESQTRCCDGACNCDDHDDDEPRFGGGDLCISE